MNDTSTGITLLDKIKSNIVAITGVLLAIPALINSGIDIYNAALKIPRTNEERINAELFKIHFNKPPVVIVPVPIRTSVGAVEMRLSIYDAGDILAEYGDHSKWFPSPMRQQIGETSWFPQAFADSLGQEIHGVGKYTQSDTTANNTISRVRYFENGVKESFTIDMNTGRIENKKVEKLSPSEFKAENYEKVQVLDYRTIDLEALKKTPK